jgi:MAP/microtubule affinity-regulating kinase
VVHRDLKPENCVLDANGTVKIIDFGLATWFVPGQLLDEFCGSPEYAAPEVLKQVPHEGPPIDIWAVGVILYDMVMGRLPFDAEASSFDVVDVDTGVTPELQVLLQRLLAGDSKKRADVVEIRASDWMNVSTCISESSEIELTSTSESMPSLSSMSSSVESALRNRLSLERNSLLAREMGFVGSAKKTLFHDKDIK